MKKLFCLLLMVGLSGIAYSVYFPFDFSTCPTKKCPEGMLLGDDGECYTCDEKEDIFVNCMVHTRGPRPSEICPNRVLVGAQWKASRFCPKNNCPLWTFMGDDGNCYSCNEEREIDVNCAGGQFWRCPNRRYYSDIGYHKSYKCSLIPFRGNFCCLGSYCSSRDTH